MTSKTIEVPRLLAWRLAGLDPNYTAAQIDADEAELRALVEAPEAPRQEPCSPAWTDDGETNLICTKCGKTEVGEAYGWVQTSGPEINLFTQEFDIVEGWTEQGYEWEELYAVPLSPDHSGGGAGVVLPEREDEEPRWSNELCPDFDQRLEWAEAKGFNRAIDKVKELNQ